MSFTNGGGCEGVYKFLFRLKTLLAIFLALITVPMNGHFTFSSVNNRKALTLTPFRYGIIAALLMYSALLGFPKANFSTNL